MLLVLQPKSLRTFTTSIASLLAFDFSRSEQLEVGRLATSHRVTWHKSSVVLVCHNRLSSKVGPCKSSYRRGLDLVVFVFFSLEYLHPEQGIQIAKGADGWPSAADDVTDVCHQAYRRTCGSSGWGNPACQQIPITSFIPRCQICPGGFQLRNGSILVEKLTITINHHYIIAAPDAIHAEGATGGNLHWRTSTGRMDALCTPVPARCYSHDHGYGGERGRLQTTVLVEVDVNIYI